MRPVTRRQPLRSQLLSHVTGRLLSWCYELDRISGVTRADYVTGEGTKSARYRLSDNVITHALASVLDGVKPGTLGAQMKRYADGMTMESWHRFKVSVRRQVGREEIQSRMEYGDQQRNKAKMKEGIKGYAAAVEGGTLGDWFNRVASEPGSADTDTEPEK